MVLVHHILFRYIVSTTVLVHHILFKMAGISKHNEICNAVLEELVNSKSSKMVSREKYEMIVSHLKNPSAIVKPSLSFGSPNACSI